MFFEKLKNLDPIYHSKYGKGTVISVNWRRYDQLLMCWFKTQKGHIFVTSKEVKENPDWSLEPIKIKKQDLKKNVVKDKKLKKELDD